MASLSLTDWQNERMPRLAAIDTHCAASALLTPSNPHLAEESLQGYVMLLSGHFQGFCRDLCRECTQVFAAHVSVGLRATVQTQFLGEMHLNIKNPNIETIRRDFERFAFTLDFGADPANALRLTHLRHMNRWRNTVAHQKATAPIGVPALTLAAVQDWRTSCDGFAIWLDGIMHAELRRILGTPPW
jgi:hypothetical protein